MIRRHYVLLLALLCAAHLTGCHSTRPTPNERPTASIVPPLTDTATVLVVPSRTLADKVLHRPAAPAYRLPAATPTRIGKKATIYYGPVTIIGKKATAAIGDAAKVNVAGKKANLATDSATQQVATNAVAGRNNTATQTATTVKPKDWKALLVGPLGWVLGIAAAGAIAYGVYYFWWLIPRRRAPANQA